MTHIFKPIEKIDLINAVDYWCKYTHKALLIYGHISTWDTSLITDMSCIFSHKYDFNDNINNWNTSNVIDMSWMFSHSYKFNQPLDKWDVSNVISMKGMFAMTSDFNQSIENWNIKNVKIMDFMFEYSCYSNKSIKKWEYKIYSLPSVNGMFIDTSMNLKDVPFHNLLNSDDSVWMFHDFQF